MSDGPAPVCPRCRGDLERDVDAGRACRRCGVDYDGVANLVDLRLASDRYLNLPAERAKAERLHAVEPTTDLMGLAAAYYDMTDDVVDHRRDRFLRHIAGAETRGEALVERLPSDGPILEVGCGTGGLLVAAARSGREIVGVDIASRWLVVARRRLADRGLSLPLIAAEAERLPWPDGTFAAVAADSLIEHCDDPTRVLAEFRRVLRPGGELLVWSPNRFTLTTDPHLGLWGVGWLPRPLVGDYLKLRRRDDWAPRTLSAWEARRLAVRCGLDDVAIEPPGISTAWAETRPLAERLPIRAYNAARRFPVARSLARAVGPLWELRARARDAA